MNASTKEAVARLRLMGYLDTFYDRGWVNVRLWAALCFFVPPPSASVLLRELYHRGFLRRRYNGRHVYDRLSKRGNRELFELKCEAPGLRQAIALERGR